MKSRKREGRKGSTRKKGVILNKKERGHSGIRTRTPHPSLAGRPARRRFGAGLCLAQGVHAWVPGMRTSSPNIPGVNALGYEKG